MLLGKSTRYREILGSDPAEARLVLAALWLLLLLPIAMIFARVGVEIISGLISLSFIFHSFHMKNWKWLREPPVVIALILWAYSVLIVSPFALDPQASFSRADWVRFIPFFAAIAYWLSDYSDELKKIAQFFVCLLVLAGIDAIHQYISGFSVFGKAYEDARLTGPFRKLVIGIYTAKMSFPLFGLLFFYAWRENNRRMKWLLLLALLFCFSVIVLSNERTATLTFTLGLVLLACCFFCIFAQTRKVIIALGVLTMVALVTAYYSQPALAHRLQITNQVIENFSNSEYAQLWKASLLMWQAHPLTGVGMLNFRSACPALLDAGKVLYCNVHSHNLYFEVLSEFGTLGFVLMLALVISIVTAVFEQHSSQPRERAILTFFAVAGLLINFFPLAPTQSFFSNWPALLAWQSIAWSMAIMRAGGEKAHG